MGLKGPSLSSAALKYWRLVEYSPFAYASLPRVNSRNRAAFSSSAALACCTQAQHRRAHCQTYFSCSMMMINSSAVRTSSSFCRILSLYRSWVSDSWLAFPTPSS